MPYEFRDRYLPVLEKTTEARVRFDSLEQKVADFQRAIADTRREIGLCEKKRDELLKQKTATLSNPARGYFSNQSSLDNRLRSGFTGPGSEAAHTGASPAKLGLESLVEATEKDLAGLKTKLIELEIQCQKAQSERNEAKSDFERKKRIVIAFVGEAEQGECESSNKKHDLQGAYNGSMSDAQQIRDEIQPGIINSSRREAEYHNHLEELAAYLKGLETTTQVKGQAERSSIPGQPYTGKPRVTNDYSGLSSVVEKFKIHYSASKLPDWLTHFPNPTMWFSESVQRYSPAPRQAKSPHEKPPPIYYNSSSCGELPENRLTMDDIINRTRLRMYEYRTHYYRLE
jgi:hypothetical protein